MTRTYQQPTRRSDRCRPTLERLESRLALDASSPGATTVLILNTPADFGGSTPLGPYLSVVSTDPGGGATIMTPPSSVAVTFDRPLAPWSLFGGDIVVQTLQAGTWVDEFSDASLPTESLDDTGTVLTLSLPTPLGPGDYRLVLPEFSWLGGLDGSTVADLGSDQVVGTFTVAQPGVTLADAQNLGTPGSTVLQVAGSLDLADNPSAVQLYKFTVAPGHHWRLAAEVDSASLYSALALFDATGHVIATADAGLPSTPRDSYLYAGLDPGTYYLGVSGQGNLPNVSGGYDPVTGTPGTLPIPQAGGAFTLGIVVDQADAPVHLLGAGLNYADPSSANPTGLTLAFSGLLNLDTLSGDPTPAFYLAGQGGQLYPMTAVGFSESTAQYTFQFDQPLPAGRYTVYVAPRSHGGATDLAGFSPVALGQPAGILWSFNVQQNWTPTGPNDLGALWVNVHKGIQESDGLLPGGVDTYRFVVENTAPFQIQTTASAGSVRMRLLAGSAQTVVATATGAGAQIQQTLTPGVYYLQFVNTGKTSAVLTWRLQETVGWESLLDNGIGQAAALSFRLVNPTSAGDLSSSAPSGSVPSSPSVPPSLLGGATGSASASDHGGSPGFGAPSVAPAGLLLTLGSTLVGRPAVEAARAADAGLDGAVAAAVAPGYGQSLVTASLAGGVSAGDGDGEGVGTPAGAAPVSVNGPANGAIAGELRAEAPRPDDLVIAAADWITWAGDAASRWLALRPVERPAADAPDHAPAAPIVLVRDDSPPAPAADRVQEAQLGPPLAVGVMTVLSLRYHQPFRRWLRRGQAVAARTGSPAFRGPHRRG